MRHPAQSGIDFDGVSALNRRLYTETLQAVGQAIAGVDPLGGPYIDEFERQIADIVGREYAVAVNSGTDALIIALRAAGVRPGDEVVVTGFSFIATASAILHVGASPVFVDIDQTTFFMETEPIEQALSGRSTAVVVMQPFGKCYFPRRLAALAQSRGLALVEDAAQAFGSVSDDGHPAGTFGQASTFSFDRTKVLGGITTGGIIATDDKEIFAEAKALRLHGRNPGTGEFARLGYNSRMSAANASVLLHRIGLQEEHRRRREHVSNLYYESLGSIPAIELPARCCHGVDNHHKFVIQSPWRDEIRSTLLQRGIQTRIHYNCALPDYPYFRGLGRTIGELSNARRVATRVLSLPIHSEMSDSDVSYVIEQVGNAVTEICASGAAE